VNTNIPKKEQNIVFLGQFCEVSQMANRCIFSFGDVQKKVGGKKNLCNFSYCKQLWRDFGRFENFLQSSFLQVFF